MALDTLKQFNWLDILCIIVLVRIVHISMKSGFSTEVFKLLGTTLAAYVSFHYYVLFSGALTSRFGLKEIIPIEFMDFLCFLALALLGYLVFVFLRLWITFNRFINVEAVNNLNRWGGFVLGVLRGVLLSSLIMFMLVISTLTYLKKSVADSYSKRYIFNIAPNTYTWVWNTITSKFMAKEGYNKTVSEVQEDFTRQ